MESYDPDFASSRPQPKDFAKVPPDFPLPAVPTTVCGAMPKTRMAEYGGKYYLPGCTPPEVFTRWDICEDLAQQLARSSLEVNVEKHTGMSEVAILDQYLVRLLRTDWGPEAEMKWVVRRVAALLNWPTPPNAASASNP